MTINLETFQLDTFALYAGSHSPNGHACFMEAASQLANERWSDHPACVSPVIAAFGRSWNDSLPDADRTRLLKPFVLKVIGTNTGPEDDEIRAWMACDWLVRTFTPVWLRKAGLADDAAALENLGELTTSGLVDEALPMIREARKSADAAWAAAWDAVRDAAGDAAGAAAWDAAGAAVRDAAWAAAGAAAGAAAWAAAGDAAGAALADTVTELQASASDLLDRMCAVGA